jgi:hypothetical protein
MNEIIKKSIISIDNYTEIKTMITSNDKASINMALTILEQVDFEESQVYIMCLVKEVFNSHLDKKSCPELYEKITNKLLEHNSDITNLSFRKIYEIVVSRKNKVELSFMLNIFKEELMSLLKDYGFSFLEFIDIELKPKKI